MPLVYKNHPGKIGEPAIGSLGVDHRWPCRIPAWWRPGLVGRGWGRTQGSPRGRFGWSDGAGRLRRAASAVPVSTDRRATSAGARLAWARKGAARAAPGGDRGREGGATLACGRPATGARRGWPQGRRLGCDGEGRCAEVSAAGILIGGREVRRGSNHSDARAPRPLSRRDRAGLGRNARAQGAPDRPVDAARWPVDGCGHDSRRNGPQGALERASSGPREPVRRGWRRRAARRTRGRGRRLAVATSRCHNF
jgi:hypothetical protein